MKHYTEILRGLREDNDLKQKEVAEILGTTQQHYSRYETGSYEIPVWALVKLSDYYGVSTDYLLGRVEYTDCTTELYQEIVNNKDLAILVSDFLALPEKSKLSILDYTSLQKIREYFKKKK